MAVRLAKCVASAGEAVEEVPLAAPADVPAAAEPPGNGGGTSAPAEGGLDSNLDTNDVRFRSLVEASPNAVLLVGADGKITLVNRQAETLFGYTRVELVGRTVESLVPERFRGHHMSYRQEFAAHPSQRAMGAGRDLFALHKDGREIPVEIGLTPVEMPGGLQTMATITDITQRKRHEEELRKAEGQRDLLTRAVEEAGEAIIITDASGVILYVNPAFERITGYPGGEIVGQTPRILQSGKQDHDFYEQMWKTLKGGEIWHGRMINKRKDGSLYEEDSTIAPVKGPSGAIINYVEIQRDVTQQSQMEARMLQAAKMEALGQLAGGVAHDFNNQLTVIKGYCDILRNDLPPQSPVREPLEEIRRAAERSATLTSQLLSFSRKQMLFPRMVDLNVVLAEMTRTLGRMLGERIHVAAVCAANRPGVKADPGQLQQAIMNLAINARDAMPEGGRLTLETANVALDGPRIGPEADIPPGRYVMLAVTDTGTGMDAQTRKQVFEPFFTTKEVGKGTGLGLSMVHGFVQQSGGRITVYSEVGHGTTFRIYLPELPGVVAEAPPPQSQNDIRGDETILVTEDEASVRALLVRLLEGRGWHVLAAANAEEALHISDGHKGQIDLLITDVVMPGLGGPDLAGRLRETRPDLKVLFITGYAGNAAAEHKLTAAGSAILTKPFSADQFTRKVRELLGEPARK